MKYTCKVMFVEGSVCLFVIFVWQNAVGQTTGYAKVDRVIPSGGEANVWAMLQHDTGYVTSFI